MSKDQTVVPAEGLDPELARKYAVALRRIQDVTDPALAGFSTEQAFQILSGIISSRIIDGSQGDIISSLHLVARFQAFVTANLTLTYTAWRSLAAEGNAPSTDTPQ